MKRIGFSVTLILSAFLLGQATAGEMLSITDVAGRTVEVEVPAKKVVLGEGRFLLFQATRVTLFCPSVFSYWRRREVS